MNITIEEKIETIKTEIQKSEAKVLIFRNNAPHIADEWSHIAEVFKSMLHDYEAKAAKT